MKVLHRGKKDIEREAPPDCLCLLFVYWLLGNVRNTFVFFFGFGSFVAFFLEQIVGAI